MNALSNLDLLSVGIAVAGIVILGFAVYSNDKKSITNKTFLLFSFFAVLWSCFNYLYNLPVDKNVILWTLRIHAFFAVWYVYYLFKLFYIFPARLYKFPKGYRFCLLPIVLIVSILALTPLVFKSIARLSPEGKIIGVTNGPGIFLFGAVVVILVVSSFVILLRKAIKARGIEKRQFDFILFGATLTFTCHIIFNFIFPAFLNNPSFVPFGAVFIFPFVALTSYAIIKHHLLNIKVIATEILTFVLAVVMLFEVILSDSLVLVIFRSSVFILVLSIGNLLIHSVRKEVEQREQLETLTKKLREANEQLKILDKARADFITIASHQLRTPPATIKWYLASILDGDYGKMDDSVHEQLRKTMSTNNSMISLIDDLLNASRIERGKMEFIFQPTNLLEITQITIDQLLPQAEMRKLELEFNKPTSPLPVITADKEKLRQVINNLIDNAIKYTQKGKIVVSIEQTAKDIIFKVSDSGRGITAGQQKGIFEKYDRGKSAARNSTGLGLGLYVAKVIVEQHKGKIWAESKGEGKGSTFVFSIPLKAKLDNSVYDLTKDQKKTQKNK